MDDFFNPYTPGFYRSLGNADQRTAYAAIAASLAWRLSVGVGRPKTVYDFGCGTGGLLAAMPDCYGTGFEAESRQREILDAPPLISPRRYVWCDLRTPRTGIVSQKADLAICIEVAEHLPAENADGLVKLLADSSDTVLFSAAAPNQGGVGHVNERPIDYWVDLFERHFFEVDGATTYLIVKDLWGKLPHTPWYECLVVFRRRK